MAINRDITYVLRGVPCSHEAIRLWVKEIKQMAVNVKVKSRRVVAFVEAEIKAD
jgi:hypothetical protein